MGYPAALGGAYRLVLIDPRGHGESDKPHDTAAYAHELMADDVVAVLDDLGIARAHYFGYSMGAGIGFVLAARAPQRFHSFVFGGGDPTDRDPDAPHRMRDEIAQGMAYYVARSSERLGPRMAAGRRARLLAGDAEVFVARARQTSNWRGHAALDPSARSARHQTRPV
jgi:pimeloyl-ACP methyl ester carboxylesterase